MQRPLPSESVFAKGQRAQEEYQEAIEKRRLTLGWAKLISDIHWDFYFIPTFRTPVCDEYARREGVDFIRQIDPNVYGLVAWGEGLVTERMHIHALVGGLNLPKKPRVGLNLKALNLKRVVRLWPHGVMAKSSIYDPRQRVAFYLPGHHELELVGECRRHRMSPRSHSAHK